MPKSTAIASQNRPTSGGAVLLLKLKLKMPSMAPPTPAIAPDTAKIMTLFQPTRTADASAATSELRTASVARPDGERISACTMRVRMPNTARNRRICSDS